MQIKLFIGILLAGGILFADLCALAQGRGEQIRLNGGMEARVNFVGRSKDRNQATIALTLSNKGPNTIYLMLVGPISAQDNTGATFSLIQASGITVCPWIGSTIQCVEGSSRFLQSYTQVDPGTDVTVNFSLNGNGSSKGPVMSFSSVFASRIVSDLVRDATLSETQKLNGIRTMNVSFVSIPVTDELK